MRTVLLQKTKVALLHAHGGKPQTLTQRRSFGLGLHMDLPDFAPFGRDLVSSPLCSGYLPHSHDHSCYCEELKKLQEEVLKAAAIADAACLAAKDNLTAGCPLYGSNTTFLPSGDAAMRWT